MPTEPPFSAGLGNAGPAPVLGPPSRWPPRIPRSRAPWWMRVRDLLLTLAGWLIFLWILRAFLVIGIAWLSPALGMRLKQMVDVGFDLDLRPYAWIAGGLVTWLAITGVLRKNYLRQQPSADITVPALPPEEQFAVAGVSISQLPQWQGSRCLHVQYGEEGRIAGVTTSGV